MDEEGIVDGDGWISDESQFYGDETTQKRLEKKACQKLKLPVPLFPRRPLPVQDAFASSNKQRTGDLLDFLKSRPQITALQKAATQANAAASKSPADTEASELGDNQFEGDPAAWQQDETIVEFLRRAPVIAPSTASLGPWLWVSNPRSRKIWKKHEAQTDVDVFIDGGGSLLQAHNVQREKFEAANPKAAPATITRKMGPYKEQLEDDLLALAVKTGVTCGKWMLFPSDEDYRRVWRLVADATAAGTLGPTSKAATRDPIDPLNLICVYTYDFTDMDDVQRVLEGLTDLGVCTRDGKAIFYKCDAYTYFGISSNNDYKLRASLYSSKEVLNGEAKATADGRINRIKKRNKPIDSFFSND